MLGRSYRHLRPAFITLFSAPTSGVLIAIRIIIIIIIIIIIEIMIDPWAPGFSQKCFVLSLHKRMQQRARSLCKYDCCYYTLTTTFTIHYYDYYGYYYICGYCIIISLRLLLHSLYISIIIITGTLPYDVSLLLLLHAHAAASKVTALTPLPRARRSSTD